MLRNRKVPPGYYTKSALKLIFGGAVGFSLFEFFNGNEKFHKDVVIPLAHRLMDPETAHRAGILMAKYRILPFKGSMYDKYDELKIDVFGMTFENPIGLAAGFDKDGEAVVELSQTGFGFIEIGSVTPEPQPGNDRPRVFRLIEDEAVINRYGFNSAGHNVVLNRLKTARDRIKPEKSGHRCYIGVNLGKNKTSTNPNMDFISGVQTLGPVADYMVINVSSPNTPGLRDMQRRGELENLLKTLKQARNVSNDNRTIKTIPLLLKVSPDLSWQEKVDIAAVCNDKKFGVDGLIVSNTTVSRPDVLKSNLKIETGGLSGKPLKTLSTECVRDFRKLTKSKTPIIAAGGISNGMDAYEKIRAGASLVQFYTALVYQGYPVIGRIKRELAECLIRDGFSNVAEAIGVDCPL